MRTSSAIVLLAASLTLAACPRTEQAEEHPASEPGSMPTERGGTGEQIDLAEPGTPAEPGEAPEREPGEAPEPAPAPEPGPPAEGPETGGQILFDPAEPVAGDDVAVRAGPITFRNGCEGIARTAVERDGQDIVVRWEPKEVPPGAFCTMALHDDWVTATLEDLEAGRYNVEVPQVGEAVLNVGDQ